MGVNGVTLIINVAFGEHLAAGVCVCVRSSKLVSHGLAVKVFI